MEKEGRNLRERRNFAHLSIQQVSDLGRSWFDRLKAAYEINLGVESISPSRKDDPHQGKSGNRKENTD
jgi:hypothetical protein